MRDLSSALDWRPGAKTLSGRAANSLVTAALHDIDVAFHAYMGDPAVPSLLTYAKHASRTVGVQLARMEAMLRFLRYFDLNAVADMMRDVRARPGVRGQAVALAAELLRRPHRFYATLVTVRRAVQWGNLQAYGSLVPAFGLYLSAETSGRDGVEALMTAGYGRGPEDPQGLVLRAFRLYRASHRIGAELARADPTERRRLETLRRRLAFSATLTLSLHEQLLFQTSECYDQPVVRRVVGRLTPTLMIEDPVDMMYLLPDGGNWAEFTDRMGLVDADAGEADLSLTDPAGSVRHYRIRPDANDSGTIFDYLTVRLLDPVAARGMGGPPLPLPAYDDGEGRAIARLRQSYRRARGAYRPGGLPSPAPAEQD